MTEDSLTVLFHNLSPCPLWSSSWTGTLYFILHAFLHPVVIFLQHMPIPTQPVLLQYQCYHLFLISLSAPVNCVFQLNATHPPDHSHLCSLKCHLIFFPYRPGLTSMQHTLYTRLTALCPGLPGWAGTRKVKPIWILLKQETVSGSGISWAICKSAPRPRQITTPTPHHSVFYRPDALPAAQPTASKHWR